MMKSEKHTNVLVMSLVIVFLFGCSGKHKQESPLDVSSDESFKKTSFPTLSIEDQVRAERLLREAELHIEGSRKIRVKNPGKGIEACRKVLEQFPNTEYVEKAKEQLRRVPQRYWEDYKIDELLGY